MGVNHCAESYPSVVSQGYAHGACTDAEIKDELNPSEYVANVQLPPVPQLVVHTFNYRARGRSRG